MHTAVKIDPHYPGPVVYVQDTPGAVGVNAIPRSELIQKPILLRAPNGLRGEA